MNKILKAAKFAKEAHKGQFRKHFQNRPYFTHVAAVAGRVAGWAEDKDLVAIAYLHDVLEDCPEIDVGVLIDMFGYFVADGVLSLTSASKLSEDKKLSRIERMGIDHKSLDKEPQYIKRIKLEDRCCNLEDILASLYYVTLNELNFCEKYALESRSLLKVIKDGDSETASYLEGLIWQILETLQNIGGQV